MNHRCWLYAVEAPVRLPRSTALTAYRAAGADRASAWMLGGALSFAAMGALMHALGPRCDWLAVALVRAVVMLASAAGLARASGSRLAVWRPGTLWVRSLAGSFSLVCNFYALTRLPVADVVTLSNVYPLWIVLSGRPWLRGRPGWATRRGVACGLAGVVLIERPHLGGDRLAAGVACSARCRRRWRCSACTGSGGSTPGRWSPTSPAWPAWSGGLAVASGARAFWPGLFDPATPDAPAGWASRGPSARSC